MPRPRKQKRVFRMPERSLYGPLDGTKKNFEITMLVEEYETIRLIDFENLNQEECAKAMNVARATVQRLYETARKKLAESLITGCVLRIDGGDFEINSEFEMLRGRGRGRGCGPKDGHGRGLRSNKGFIKNEE